MMNNKLGNCDKGENMKLKRNFKTLGFLGFFSIFSSLTYAAGFQLYEENVTNLGNAYAGMGAEANDASTEFYNPAGLIRLDTGQVVTSLTDIDIDINAHLKNATSTSQLLGLTTVTPIFGARNVQGGANVPIPSFHFAYPFCHKWALGFGTNVPFGLQTDYPDDSIGRFLATESKLTVINVGPSLAYAFSDAFSLGAGIDSQYADISLKQKVPQFSPVTNPGFFNNDADSWGWGWRVGALYQYDPNNRVGVTYHSRVHHELRGDALLNIDLTPLGIVQTNFPGHLTANVTFPDYIDLSGYHAINCQWAWLASIDFIHWSTVQILTANYSGYLATNPVFNITSASIPLNFDDTWRFATGLNYKPLECLTLRGGIAYDPTPIPNSESRTLRLPDNDRFWVALGGQYIINRAFTVDAGYSHLFVRHAETSNSQQFNASANIPVLGRQNLTLIESAVGNFNSSVNQFGAQLTWNLQSV